jgi:hypothetical protein
MSLDSLHFGDGVEACQVHRGTILLPGSFCRVRRQAHHHAIQCAGQQPGDANLSLIEVVWLPVTMSPHMNQDIRGESSGVWSVVTVEVVTDQRILQG